MLDKILSYFILGIGLYSAIFAPEDMLGAILLIGGLILVRLCEIEKNLGDKVIFKKRVKKDDVSSS
ncbi:MAG: hypothetical protein CL840_16320 [Crocinitomicaceae bacterium]|nr:hypothetical protein [Crocinitomicaceae bacterium]|tara:strand:+ start:1761 stop:1958 length:198 start_codon:yes stop_codon:yes gene_type:complete